MLDDAMRDGQVLSVRDRLLLLKSQALLQAADAELLLLAEVARYRTYAAGERISEGGQLAAHIHLMLEGAIRIKRHSGVEQIVEAPGAVGWPSFLANDERGLDLIAHTTLRTMDIPCAAMDEILEQSFVLTRTALTFQAKFLLTGRSNLPAAPGSVHDEPLGEYPARTLTAVEQVLSLADASIFEAATMDGLMEMAENFTEIRVPAGTVLWRIGDPPSFSLRLRYGRVRCRTADGTECVIGAPFVMGFFDSLAEVDRVYEAVAETEVVGGRSDVETTLASFEQHPGLRRGLLTALSGAVLAQLESGVTWSPDDD